MNIEIITTGDEVVSGVIVDTNTQWIAERVSQLGHIIVRHTSIADDAGDIGDALKSAAKRADAVIVSGGLGPTSDDITVEAAAKAFGVKLVRNEEVLDEIRSYFERIGRVMSPSNEKQADIPDGASIIPNFVGTAPGVHAKFDKKDFFFLPGVPKELYKMFDEYVMPWLAKQHKDEMYSLMLHCFGMPEATIDEKLRPLNLKDVRLSFRVKFPEIILKLVVRAKNSDEAKNAVLAAANSIREILGEHIYAEGETSLAELVGQLLLKNKMTVSVAESCTGGLLCSTITDVAGASEWFDRGVVSYSNQSKMQTLGVTEEILRSHGAVSADTAIAMAEAIKRISGSQIGVGITGIAGPSGGSPEKPVGTVYIALATPDGSEPYHFKFSRDRLWFKQIVVATALDLVRRYLIKL